MSPFLSLSLLKFSIFVSSLSFKRGSSFIPIVHFYITHSIMCAVSGPVFLFPQHSSGYGLDTSHLVFCIMEYSN